MCVCSGLCALCPANSVSVAGSTTITSCICFPNFYGVRCVCVSLCVCVCVCVCSVWAHAFLSRLSVDLCKVTRTHTHTHTGPNGGPCTTCPAFTHSPSGSATITSCVCDANYWVSACLCVCVVLLCEFVCICLRFVSCVFCLVRFSHTHTKIHTHSYTHTHIHTRSHAGSERRSLHSVSCQFQLASWQLGAHCVHMQCKLLGYVCVCGCVFACVYECLCVCVCMRVCCSYAPLSAYRARVRAFASFSCTHANKQGQMEGRAQCVNQTQSHRVAAWR